MPTEFQEKIRSIGAPRKWGGDNRKVVQSDIDGTVAGVEIEHWNDSQDAVVKPKTVKFRAGNVKE